MNFLRLTPVFLSALLLGAHFLRSGSLILTLLSIAFPAILVVPRPWAARVAQIVLVLGGIEWIRTLVQLAVQRNQAGEPWLRMALIVGAVSLVTICSALVFRLRALRARYSL